MAIVIGSTFKPFNYSEMLAPVQQATETHQAVEDAYGELDTKASVWEGLANEQTDPRAYKTYMDYAADLRSKADMLASQGLTPTTRKALNSMRARYASDIAPIEIAYKKREDLSKEQREYRAKNPTAIFDRDMSVTSLDELIANPGLQYQSLSGSEITNQVSNAAKNLARQVRENPAKWKNILGGQYFEILRNTGFRDEDVLAVLSQNSKASPVLQKIMDDAIESSGVKAWNNKSALDAVSRYAGQGLWSAIGTEDRKQLRNRLWDLRQKAAAAGGMSEPPMYPIDRRIKTQAEIEESTSRMKKELELIKEGFRDPSKFKSGWKKSSPTPGFYGPMSSIPTGGIETPQYKAFKKWSERLGTDDLGKIEEAINREIKNSATMSFSDIYKTADPKFLNRTLSNRISAVRDPDKATDDIHEYDISTGEQGDTVKPSEFEKYLGDNTILSMDDNDNIVIKGTDKKGNSKIFTLRASIFDTSLNGVNLNQVYNRMKEAKGKGDLESYQRNRLAFFVGLDAINNSYAKVQGNTLGAKDVLPGEASYLDAIAGYEY